MNITHCEYGEWVPTVHRRIREHDQTITNKTLHSVGLSSYLWICLSPTACHPEAALPSLQSSLQRNKQQPLILQAFTCLVSFINSKRERGQIVINAPLCSKIQHSSYTALHPNLRGAGGKMNLKLLRAIGWLLMRVNLFGFVLLNTLRQKRNMFQLNHWKLYQTKLLKAAEEQGKELCQNL